MINNWFFKSSNAGSNSGARGSIFSGGESYYSTVLNSLPAWLSNGTKYPSGFPVEKKHVEPILFSDSAYSRQRTIGNEVYPKLR